MWFCKGIKVTIIELCEARTEVICKPLKYICTSVLLDVTPYAYGSLSTFRNVLHQSLEYTNRLTGIRSSRFL
jgi:hypothetical protein